MIEPKKAVVVLSGGLDSTTALAIAKKSGFDVHAITIDYGQRHGIEVQAARQVAAYFAVSQHVVVPLDLRIWGNSALTDNIAVPKSRNMIEISKGIPATYVPARNTIFLSLALGYAEAIEASDIFIGVNAVDYSGYPDCRPEFLEAYERMANLATKMATEGGQRFRIHAPLINLTKAAIVRKGIALGVDYGITRTCYDPLAEGRACGACDACLLRLKGFQEAGIDDPIPYAKAIANQ